MTDKVIFISRGKAINWLKYNTFSDDAFISVSDSNTELKEMTELVKDYCGPSITLQFFDDDEGMSEDQAKALLSFIETHRDRKFVVHCFAGVSRSGAISKFINEHLDGNDWYLEDYQGHNRVVFNQLHKAAGTSLIAYYEELEKNDRKLKM